MNNRPIGMFDSGIGGITVLKEYLKLFTNEKFIYYADTKNIPYGNKSKEQIIEYSKKIVEFFISKNVKAIVIACGTVSSLAYDYLIEHYDIPIFNIIDPLVKNIQYKNIGVIATQASIKSHVWENKIHKYNQDTNIYPVACPLLVPLAEKGLYKTFISKIIIKKYLEGFKDKNIECLVLGCTHYPLFNKFIQNELGDNIKIINLGEISALDFQKQSNIEFSSNMLQEQNVSYIASGNINKFLKKIKKME